MEINYPLVMETIIDLFFILSILYACLLLVFSVLILIRKLKRNEQFPNVSIVICARNEERILPKTLSYLEKLDYPKEKIEFILVNHASTDGTAQIFDDFVAHDPIHRKVLHIQDNIEGLLGKAAPWHCGMLACTNEIVLTTGADCFVPPTWVRRTVSYFKQDTQIVSGPALLVRENETNSLFDRVQNSDMLFIQGLGFAVNSLGLGGAGLANNFAIRKSAYFSIGGFPKLGFSICEDVRLSQGVLKKYHNKAIRYHFDLQAIPTTDPEPIKKLPNMKIRWSMGVWRLNNITKLFVVLIFSLHLLLPILYIITKDSIALTALLMIIGSEMMFSMSTLHLVKKWKDIIAVPFFIPYLWLYMIFVSPWVIFRIPLKWKGLKVREPIR
ncbi:MAG: glycosyltransferase [bacterium]|nr:glycosyltransferase [bacterium]